MNGFDMTIFHHIFFTFFFLCESTESHKIKKKQAKSIAFWLIYFIKTHCVLYWSLYIFLLPAIRKGLMPKNDIQFTISMRIHEISHKIWYNHVKRQKESDCSSCIYRYCHILIICQIREIWAKNRKNMTLHTQQESTQCGFFCDRPHNYWSH